MDETSKNPPSRDETGRMPRRIAVLGAFRIEVERLGAVLEETMEPAKKGPLVSVTGRLAGRELLVGISGMGKVRAAAAAQAAVECFAPDLLVSLGTAGALAPGIPPLEVILADRVVAHDVVVPRRGPDWHPADPTILEKGRTMAVLAGFRVGALVTGDRPVLDEAERDRLYRAFGALAVDMEAAAIHTVARINGIRAVTVKAITDSADKNGKKDFERHVRDGAARAQRVLIQLLEPDP